LKNSSEATRHFSPHPIDNNRLANLCGPVDGNLRQIAAALDVTIFRRGEKFIADGVNAERAVALLEKFYALADKAISVEDIQLSLVEQRATCRHFSLRAGTGAIKPMAHSMQCDRSSLPRVVRTRQLHKPQRSWMPT
jgi:phosphate starvation-inducible PhoH-like protein